MHARPCLLPCHLGPVQLNLHELANRNQNVAYSEQKEGLRQTLPYNPDVRQTPKKDLGLRCSYSN